MVILLTTLAVSSCTARAHLPIYTSLSPFTPSQFTPPDLYSHPPHAHLLIRTSPFRPSLSHLPIHTSPSTGRGGGGRALAALLLSDASESGGRCRETGDEVMAAHAGHGDMGMQIGKRRQRARSGPASTGADKCVSLRWLLPVPLSPSSGQSLNY